MALPNGIFPLPEKWDELLSKRVVPRKDFLKLTGLVTLGTLVSAWVSQFSKSVQAQESSTEQKHHWGMVIDLIRCVNCKACTISCRMEHANPPGVVFNPVVEEELGEFPNVRRRWFPKPCFHCEKPPCVPVCPVTATYKRPQDGIVVVDPHKCIGCRYCITACPYGARSFDFGENYIPGENPFNDIMFPEFELQKRKEGKAPMGTVRKCDFCIHLQDEQGHYLDLPACAKTCMGKAIHFGDFLDPMSEVSRLVARRHTIRLKEELGTEPNVYYAL